MQSNRNNLILIGIAGVVLSVVGQAISLGAPTLDEGGGKLQEWLTDNRGLAIAAFYLVGLGLMLGIGLIVAIRQRLLSAEGGSGLLANTFALGSLLGLAVVGAGLGAFGVLAYNADTLSAEAAQILNSTVYLTIAAADFPIALGIAAAAIVIIRTRTLHVAIGYLGLAAALIHLVAPLAFDTGSGIASPQTACGIAAIAYYLWMAGAGVLLLRSSEEEATVLGLAAAAVMTEVGVLAGGAAGATTSAGATAPQAN